MKKAPRHEMVPEHLVLSEKEVNHLLEKFNISKSQLPVILSGDPAIKGLEVNIGDVIKVTRRNPVTGTSYAFRVVSTL
jgi:DNA-directed RNA polymerase subunit H